jgi:hypothetical protein
MRLNIGSVSPVPTKKKEDVAGCRADCIRHTLKVDCLDCPSPQDLVDQRCLKGVLRQMREHPSARSIVLSGGWEVRYEGEAVADLHVLASILCTLDEAARLPFPEKSCAQCPSSPRSLFENLVERFPSRNGTKHRIGQNPTTLKGDCADCHVQTRSIIEAVDRRMSELEVRLTRRAFLIVEGGKVEKAIDTRSENGRIAGR